MSLKDIKILDCTLRDGGYLNNWEFKKEDIKAVLSSLNNACVDFIELGFLKEEKDPSSTTLFSNFDELKKYSGKNLCAMIKYGEFDLKNIPDSTVSPIKTLRFIYKKPFKDISLDYCKKLKELGYRLFINPTYIHDYSEDEILDTIKKVNEIEPYCFSIVDSKGILEKNKLIKIYNIVNDNLKNNINLCCHSHNSKMCFNNIKELISLANRKLIIDSTLFGIGRGKGNLKTEEIARYLNQNYQKNYNEKELLKISDKIKEKYAVCI